MQILSLFAGSKRLKRIVLSLYVGMMVILVVSTFMAAAVGERMVSEHIYDAWWFMAWWGALGVSLLLVVVQWLRNRARHAASCRGIGRCAVIHLHVAFLLILLGAALTALTARRGVVYLQPRLEVNRFLDAAHHRILPLPFTLQLDSLEVTCDPGTMQHADYVSHLHVDTVAVTVSMNRVTTVQGYRLTPYSYDEAAQVSWLSVNYDPWGIGVTYLGYLWFACSFLIWLRRYVAYALLALVAGVALQLYAESTPLQPVLRSAWLGIHVSFIVMAYTLFAFLGVNGVMGMCMSSRREALMRQSLRLLRPAEGLLGVGIFMGAVWANQSWGRYWAWDSKEVWALITFMLYALPFHYRRFSWLQQPSRFHLFMLLAFLSVLITYFGCNYFMSGLHSYVG